MSNCTKHNLWGLRSFGPSCDTMASTHCVILSAMFSNPDRTGRFDRFDREPAMCPVRSIAYVDLDKKSVKLVKTRSNLQNRIGPWTAVFQFLSQNWQNFQFWPDPNLHFTLDFLFAAVRTSLRGFSRPGFLSGSLCNCRKLPCLPFLFPSPNSNLIHSNQQKGSTEVRSLKFLHLLLRFQAKKTLEFKLIPGSFIFFPFFFPLVVDYWVLVTIPPILSALCIYTAVILQPNPRITVPNPLFSASAALLFCSFVSWSDVLTIPSRSHHLH